MHKATIALFALLSGACAIPTEPTIDAPVVPQAPVTVNVRERFTEAIVSGASVRVNGRLAATTDVTGAALVSVPAGIETELSAESPSHKRFRVVATISAGSHERWTFYLERTDAE